MGLNQTAAPLAAQIAQNSAELDRMGSNYSTELDFDAYRGI